MSESREDESATRLAAFCSTKEPDIFQAIAHAPEIWRDDPFDVAEIHAEAREVFEALVRRAAAMVRLA